MPYNESIQYVVVCFELPNRYGIIGKQWEILFANYGAILSKGMVCELLSMKLQIQFKMNEIIFHSIAITIKTATP